MKLKLKDKNVFVPSFDSYCGLATEEWVKLNTGGTVDLKYMPQKLEKYVEKVKPKKEKDK